MAVDTPAPRREQVKPVEKKLVRNYTSSGGGSSGDGSYGGMTRDQAMASGLIDAPGTTEKKLAEVGANQRSGETPRKPVIGRDAAVEAERQAYNQRQPGYAPNQPIQPQQQYKPDTSIFIDPFLPAGHRREQYIPDKNSIVLTKQQYDRYQTAGRTQVGRGVLTEEEAQTRALYASGYNDHLQYLRGRMTAQPGSLAAQHSESKDAATIQKAGTVRTMGAILSSIPLTSKATETELRGLSELAGFTAGYKKSVGELMTQTADRLRNKPTLGAIFFESPITAAIPIGAGFKVGGYLARTGLIKAGGIVGKASPRIGGIISGSQKIIEPALTVGGVAYVGSDVVQSKDIYEAGGKIAAYGAMTPGAMLGYGAAGKGLSLWQTRGLKTVEAPIKPEVLIGKENLPMTRAGSFEAFKREFETPTKQYAGYHATPESFGKAGFEVRGLKDVELRAKDVPGLYISPYKQGTSPHFLRIGGEGGYKFNLESFKTSSPLNPEINLIKGITDIKRIPGGKNVQKARNFLRSTIGQTRGRSRGLGFIEPKIEMGGFHGEAQAVLAPTTKISGIEAASRIKYKGYYVPLVERSIVSEGVVSQAKPTVESRLLKAGFRERGYYEPTPSSYPISISAITKQAPMGSKLSVSSKTQTRSNISSISKPTSSRTSVMSESRTASRPIRSYPGQSGYITPSSRTNTKSSIISSVSSKRAPSSRYTPGSRGHPSSVLTTASRYTPQPEKIIKKFKSSIISGLGKRSRLATIKPNKYFTALGGKTFRDLTLMGKKTRTTKKTAKKRSRRT